MKTYINLTAGIEWLKGMKFHNLTDIRFLHLQSSHIERQAWDKFFYNLDNDLLLNLAMSERCVILDATSNPKSKIEKIGVPVIVYVLSKLWYGVELKIDARLQNYEIAYQKLTKPTKRKLRYYKQFAAFVRNIPYKQGIKLECVSLFVRKENTRELVKWFNEFYFGSKLV